LKFIKIQGLNKKIDHPKEIDKKYLDTEQITEGSSKVNLIDPSIKFINVLQDRSQKPRQIAIFTDAHALYEPTLAVLEDARKNGITEIYSLGDNIGTGPNPKEVLDLLDEYGVKSVQGNHELYALGIDKLPEEIKKHLEQTGAANEARRNSEWTRKQLTEDQVKEISNYPKTRIIEIGGKKIYLTHYSKKYDDGTEMSIPKEVDKVLQGHVHFSGTENTNGKEVVTLRGTGIGNKSGSKDASYIVLTETKDGYKMEVRTVKYNDINLYHTINESSMPLEDANKIENWSGVRR